MVYNKDMSAFKTQTVSLAEWEESSKTLFLYAWTGEGLSEVFRTECAGRLVAEGIALRQYGLRLL